MLIMLVGKHARNEERGESRDTQFYRSRVMCTSHRAHHEFRVAGEKKSRFSRVRRHSRTHINRMMHVREIARGASARRRRLSSFAFVVRFPVFYCEGCSICRDVYTDKCIAAWIASMSDV